MRLPLLPWLIAGFMAQPAFADTANVANFRAAWAMVATGEPSEPAPQTAFGKPVFLQPMGFRESAVITQSVPAQITNLPMTQGTTSLQFNAGDRYFRVVTNDRHKTIFCSAGSKFEVHRSIVRMQMRFCLADDDGDGVFDHLLTGSISHPATPVGIGAAILLSLLGTDDISFQPMVLRDDPSMEIRVPYRLDTSPVTQFKVGPVIFRNGTTFAAGLMLGDPSGSPTTLFDPAARSVIAPGQQAMATKRPRFADFQPINLDPSQAALTLAGAVVVIKSVSADAFQATVQSGFNNVAMVPIAYQGGLLEQNRATAAP